MKPKLLETFHQGPIFRARKCDLKTMHCDVLCNEKQNDYSAEKKKQFFCHSNNTLQYLVCLTPFLFGVAHYNIHFRWIAKVVKFS